MQIAELKVKNDPLRQQNDQLEKIVLAGYIMDEPDIRTSSQKLKIKVEKSVILVTVPRHPVYQYLDQVKVAGYLKTPFVSEEFNYQNYLMKDGIYSVMDFPKLEILFPNSSRILDGADFIEHSRQSRNKAIGTKDHHHTLFTFLYEKVLYLKGKLQKSLAEHFLKPERFIQEGILLGNDKNMPKELKDQFNSSGLSHVTAVSGGNIVIFISLLVPFLLMMGLWRGQAFYVSVAFVWLYILLVGLPASGVRAAIMGSLFLLAEKLGRQRASSRIIVLAAALMLLQNPFLLRYDIGFELSFLASLGIIHIKPVIDDFIKLKIPKEKSIKKKILKKMNFFLDIISVTVSAQLAVLPILIYSFGAISLVAPLTNLLVLPIIPLLMVLGFLSAALGIFSHFLGWVFYIPCQLLLFYFLWVLKIFDQPWATTSISHVSWIFILVYYMILALGIWYVKKTKTPKFLDY